MRLVLLSHGWAYCLDFWQPWVAAQKQLHAQAHHFVGIERGYFDRPAGLYQLNAQSKWEYLPVTSLNAILQTHQAVHWVGHSWGFAQAVLQLSSPPEQWDWADMAALRLHQYPYHRWHLHALHGFTRFCKLHSDQAGTSPRIISRMLSKLNNQPLEVLGAFWNQCGVTPSTPTRIHTERLATDLNLMAQVDVSGQLAQLLQQGLHLEVLASKTDPIVPMALAEQCFKALAPIVWLDTAHSGPCAEATRYTWPAQR